MKRTLSEFARAAGGRLAGADATYTEVVSDTRALKPRQLFIALKGPSFNGNDFVPAALGAGAAGAVVDALRSRSPRASGARRSPDRSSGSPAATARRPPRR
jgi:UDP-N-acetylmuramyl pentapeptide synthase